MHSRGLSLPVTATFFFLKAPSLMNTHYPPKELHFFSGGSSLLMHYILLLDQILIFSLSMLWKWFYAMRLLLLILLAVSSAFFSLTFFPQNCSPVSSLGWAGWSPWAPCSKSVSSPIPKKVWIAVLADTCLSYCSSLEYLAAAHGKIQGRFTKARDLLCLTAISNLHSSSFCW